MSIDIQIFKIIILIIINEENKKEYNLQTMRIASNKCLNEVYLLLVK